MADTTSKGSILLFQPLAGSGHFLQAVCHNMNAVAVSRYTTTIYGFLQIVLPPEEKSQMHADQRCIGSSQTVTLQLCATPFKKVAVQKSSKL